MKIEFVHPTKWDNKTHHWWPRTAHLNDIGLDGFGQILELSTPSVMTGGAFACFLRSKTALDIYWIRHLGPPNRKTGEDETSDLKPWDVLFKKSRMSTRGRAVTMRICCRPSRAVCLFVS